ncbi:hypothetical protein CL614_00190 [archaeon]|nr:hypothetical protein [archaeon]|tara:strand:+ start:180 stop:359 length:180 start_codon:yes stop_codon:yes gene_type:complete
MDEAKITVITGILNNSNFNYSFEKASISYWHKFVIVTESDGNATYFLRKNIWKIKVEGG